MQQETLELAAKRGRDAREAEKNGRFIRALEMLDEEELLLKRK